MRNQTARSLDTRRTRRQAGFTYLVVLFAVALSTAALAAASQVWSHAQQREREVDLLFVGSEFRTAIGLYYQRTPGVAKRYPADLKDLLKDGRYPTTQRYLRKIYADPLTGKAEWGLVKAPEGGIMGVYSLSERTPVKTAQFRLVDKAFTDKARYSEWQFSYAPAPLAAGAAAPGIGAPGRGLPATSLGGIPPAAASVPQATVASPGAPPPATR